MQTRCLLWNNYRNSLQFKL